MIPLVCYHADCPDGFGAAWLLGQAFGENEKVACYYDRAMPDCTGRDVTFVDFCPKADALIKIGDECRTLTVFDHHASQVAEVDAAGIRRHDNMLVYSDLSELGGLNKCEAVMDMGHSGVGLVDAFVKRWRGWVAPAWFANIEDRDLWRFELPSTAAVFAAVTARPYTDEAWTEMASMSVADLAAEGRGVEMYRQRLIERTLETAFEAYVGGHQVWVACAPYAICSDVAGELAKRKPELFGATYVQYGDRKKYSLRSVDGGLDVSVVAQSMDPTGGGHVRAAGANVYG